MTRMVLAAALGAVLAGQASAQQPRAAQELGGRRPEAVQQGASLRNPRALRAVQLLERRPPGTARPRVRFEWDQVRGAREYLLVGRWMQPPSWTVQAAEFHVSRQNAAAWSESRVAFEVALPAGSHSWKVIALFGTRNVGDTANATPFAFDVR